MNRPKQHCNMMWAEACELLCPISYRRVGAIADNGAMAHIISYTNQPVARTTKSMTNGECQSGVSRADFQGIELSGVDDRVTRTSRYMGGQAKQPCRALFGISGILQAENSWS